MLENQNEGLHEKKMSLFARKKPTEVLKEKAQFAEGIQQLWVRSNYEQIKEAHNELLSYLKEKDFDFFSVQYLLTMTYMELLISEYLESHSAEVKEKLTKILGGEK